MKITTRYLASLLLIVVLLGGVEVLAEPESESPDGNSCPAGIIEGPDPIGLKPCLIDSQDRSSSARSMTNGASPRGTGEASPSEHPEVGFDPATGRPFMVWADRNAGDHDIAFSAWAESRWGRVEYVAATLADERDPRVWVGADGAIYVAWWTVLEEEIQVAHRDPVTTVWSAPRRVTRGGRRPSVGVAEDRLWVAWERESKSGGTEVVVAAETPVGQFDARVVAVTDRRQRLDVILHAESGRLWVDWKDSSRELGFVEWNGTGWLPVERSPWDDRSWAGEQEARARVRIAVITR